MSSTSVAAGQAIRRQVPILPSELSALAFFCYLMAMGVVRQLHWNAVWWLAVPPTLIFAAIRMEQSASRPWTRVTREFMNLGFILAGYWSVEFFNDASPKNLMMQNTWVQWDRVILYDWGFRAAVESLGWFLPLLLETVYMLLYAIPPLYLAILFLTGSRTRTYRFLFVVLVGTLAVYACLPFIPVMGPRMAFPGMDLPGYTSFPRFLNTWIHDHMDISTSVFPSGHVGVAFSTAFGLLSAVPRRRWLWVSAFAAALIVYMATVYCRYHYAVDGFASILITSAVWLTVQRVSNPDPANF